MVLVEFITPYKFKNHGESKMRSKKNFKGSRIITEFNTFFIQAFLSTGGKSDLWLSKIKGVMH